MRNAPGFVARPTTSELYRFCACVSLQHQRVGRSRRWGSASKRHVPTQPKSMMLRTPSAADRNWAATTCARTSAASQAPWCSGEGRSLAAAALKPDAAIHEVASDIGVPCAPWRSNNEAETAAGSPSGSQRLLEQADYEQRESEPTRSLSKRHASSNCGIISAVVHDGPGESALREEQDEQEGVTAERERHWIRRRTSTGKAIFWKMMSRMPSSSHHLGHHEVGPGEVVRDRPGS